MKWSKRYIHTEQIKNVKIMVTIQHLDFRLSEIPAIFHLKEVLMPHPHLFCAFCR
jgi:hypothetical protein